MYLEDLIIAHELLSKLGGERIEQLLDLMEDSSYPLPPGTMEALRWFLKELEVELGEDHPAVIQLRGVLSMPSQRDGAASVPSSTWHRELRIG